MRGLNFEHQLCWAVLILSPALGLERDAGAGRLYPLPGWVFPGRAVGEVLDTDIPAHPPSKLETGLRCFCVVNSEL